LPVLLAAACHAQEPPASAIAGTIQNHRIDEASGIARSQRYPDVFWVTNDDGPSVLYALDSTGRDLGRVTIRDASNRDWEDLASFTLDGTPYLLVADIGDNDSERKDVRIYVVEEPEAGDNKVDYAWRIEFSYPEGPRDAEAVAVDTDNRRVLVLTKRDLPPLLYSLPLQPESDKRQTATRLGVIGSLPQPSHSDVEFAPKTDDWYWQPTGMDISAAGSEAVILTYGGVFLFPRAEGEDWLQALQRQPRVLSRTRNRHAEAVTFDPAGRTVYITIEQRNAPLYRLTTAGDNEQ